MMILNNDTLSAKIDRLLNTVCKDWYDIQQKFSELGITALIDANNSDLEGEDCRDWAFNLIGLGEYCHASKIETRHLSPLLKRGEIHELMRTDQTDEGVLVAYSFRDVLNYYDHFGVCVAFKDGTPLIESRWEEDMYLYIL